MSARAHHRPRVSVVIPTYNRAAALARTLESLTSQTLDPSEYEVVVADDGSSDGTRGVVTGFEDRMHARYAWQEDLGFRVAAARNMGARLAGGPLLVFMDSGTLAPRTFLASHLAEHDGSACPRAVMGYTLGYRPYDLSPSLAEELATVSADEAVERFGADPRMRDLRHDNWEAIDFDMSGLALPWLYFWSMNVSVRTRHFWEVGGFDERYTSWGVEDQDLGYRLYRHGCRLVASRTAAAFEPPHPRDTSTYGASGRRNTQTFFEKFRDPNLEILHATLAEGPMWPAEAEAGALSRWTSDARCVVPGKDIRGAAVAAARAGRRVVVLGVGDDVPAELQSQVLIDFDEDRVVRARQAGARDARHSVGLHTGLADDSADVVVVTERWAGLWPRWGQRIVAEARRVAPDVYLAPGLPS